MDALRHEREDLWFVSRADFITAVKEFKSGKWPIVLTSSGLAGIPRRYSDYDNKDEGILGDTSDLDYINETVVRLIGNTVCRNGNFGISCGTIKTIWIQV